MASSAMQMQCQEVWGGNEPADSAVAMPGLDAWVYCRPFGQSEVGGDVYYVSSCATGRVTRLLLADVSGHGHVVAETAAALRGLMRRYVNYIDQTAFVREMNRRFAEMSRAGSFATALVMTFFGPTNDLTLCIAGHPPPLLYRAAIGQWSLLDGQLQGRTPGNLPLGIEGGTPFEQFGVRLQVGDIVVCFTDGVIESRDAAGEMLGSSGLLRIVQELDATHPPGLVRALLQAVSSQNAENPGGDDVTLLLFHPNGHGSTVPLKQRFCAPFRVLRGVVGSLRHDDQPAPWPELSLPSIGGAMVNSLNRLWSARNRRQTGITASPPPPDAPAT